MKGILLPAQVEGIRTRKDNTVAITLGTQEMDPSKAGALFGLNNKVVVAYISQKEEITNDEQEIIDSIEPEGKGRTPSQRLRSVLYLLWESNNEGYKDKSLHYLHHMEKIIEHLKTKLPER